LSAITNQLLYTGSGQNIKSMNLKSDNWH